MHRRNKLKYLNKLILHIYIFLLKLKLCPLGSILLFRSKTNLRPKKHRCELKAGKIRERNLGIEWADKKIIIQGFSIQRHFPMNAKISQG